MSTIATRHSHFFFDDGNIVLQVEETLFKIHRFFLVQHSPIIRDMLDLPPEDCHTEGTESNPIILPGDTSDDWVVLLSYLYPTQPFGASDYTGEELLSILRIAHKYCMEGIEQDAITILRTTSNPSDLFYLLAASSIVQSQDLRRIALKGLVEALPHLTLEQAQSLDFDAILALYTKNRTSCFQVHRKLAPYPMPWSPNYKDEPDMEEDDDDDRFLPCWRHHIISVVLGGVLVAIFTI